MIFNIFRISCAAQREKEREREREKEGKMLQKKDRNSKIYVHGGETERKEIKNVTMSDELPRCRTPKR